jgi:molecular chaperone GrpE
VTENRRWSDNLELDHEPSTDQADIASTDMSVEPPSRGEGPQDVFPAGTGLPAEPPSEAIRRLEGELAATQDRYLRLAAEYDNFRKRTTRERAELNDRAQAALVARLLDVLDDMERLTAGGGAAAPEALREVTALVDRKFRKELEGAGLERIDPAGDAFDPGLHEAVSIVPPAKPEQDQTVSATFQAGYRFKGTLIRPARVQVYSSQGQG